MEGWSPVMEKPLITDQLVNVHAATNSKPKPNPKLVKFKVPRPLPPPKSLTNTPPESTNPCTNPPIRTWIVCDALDDQLAFENLALNHGLNCERILQSNQIANDMSTLLTDHVANPPQLVWIAMPKHNLPNLENQKQYVAVRLLLYQQLQSGGRIVVEGAAMQPTSKGMYVPAEWYDAHDLRNSQVWWCQLGFNSAHCISEYTVSNFDLPSRCLKCCGRVESKTNRRIKPKYTPAGQYIGLIKALRESFNVDAPSSSSDSDTQAFPTNSKVKKKAKAQGAKTLNEGDGPGEHEDIPKVKTKDLKVVEDHYDDCGDDLSAITATDEQLFTCFLCSPDADCESDKSYDSEDEDVFQTMFDSTFMSWSLPGSEESAERDVLLTRPLSTKFSNCHDMLTYLNSSPGHHDICELFGGKGLTTQIAIRRKLKTGPNFDVSCDIDLLDPSQVTTLWKYIVEHKPKCVVAGPPCTSFSAWSRLNSKLSPENHARSLLIGTTLAKLVAEIAMYQLAHGRHFLIENPWGSALWLLPCFILLISQPNVSWAQCDQCMTGLCDPTGIPTRKCTCFLGSCERIVKRLRLKCDGSHSHVQLAGSVNGIARCKFAQTWTRRLCELIVSGIIDALSYHSSAFPAVKAKKDPYGGSVSCRGCVAHAAKHDPRHDRREGICRFPYDQPITWDCVACKKFLPSTHSQHVFDETCQWTLAASRQSTGRMLPPLKDPKQRPHVEPAIDLEETPDPPPPVDGQHWFPVTDLILKTTLETCQERDGWHNISDHDAALTWTNGRTIRNCEPRYAATTFACRSTYGCFPEISHDHGCWWEIESRVPLTTKQIGYPVPTLIMIFHRTNAVSKEKESRSDKRPINSVETAPVNSTAAGGSSSSSRPPAAQPAEPEEPGDNELPAVEPDVIIEPDWTSFDLGRCLRALRSDRPQVYARALQRLHLRWWHCSSTRMTALLRAAGVQKPVLDLIPQVCQTCKVCRAWQKPGNRSVTSTRLSDEFNNTLQFDLLFFEEHTIGCLIDEATRWECAEILPGKETEHLIRFITDRWVRVFGSPKLIVSDQEGGLFSEESSIWAERTGFSIRPKPVNSHAALIERHHQVLRDLLHKLTSQIRVEKLQVEINDVLSQAIFAKNVLTNVAGFSPFLAVFGRWPNVLSDLEAAGQSALRDGEGGIAGANRHSVRVRELALQAMISATAVNRIKLADKTNTRSSGELLNLSPGDQVDVFRNPTRKDLSGWRGPAEVLSTRRIEEGVIDLKWGGRTIIARAQDCRRHIMFVFLLQTLDAPFLMIQRLLMQILQGTMMISWLSTPSGWQLSKEAKDRPSEHSALLRIAANQLNIPRCVGGRIGRGYHVLTGLHDIVTAYILWWPSSTPALYQVFAHSASETVHLRQLFNHSEHDDFCWIQFFSVDVPKARRIRHRDPQPLVANDPNDPYTPDHPMVDVITPVPSEPMPSRPPSSVPSAAMPQRPPSSVPSSVTAVPSRASDIWVPAPWKAAGGHSVPAYKAPQAVASKNSSIGSRVTRSNVNSESSQPVATSHSAPDDIPYGNRRPPPSNASSSHRPHKTAHIDRNYGGSSSSTSRAPSVPIGPPPVPPHVPLLPIHSDNESDISTLNADDIFDTLDIEFYSHSGEADSPWCVFLSAAGEIVLEKSVGELSAKEIKAHWNEVSKGVMKELLSFTELGVFRISPKGTTGNHMTSRWVMRWKWNPTANADEIKCRLTVRGFMDLAGPELLTYAGTASRWGQRLVVAIACQKKWRLVCADVGSAFLKSLTFKEIAEINNEPVRKCSFSPPSGYADFVRQLPGCSHYDDRIHELELLKPVYGLKDAPRAWRRRLHTAMVELGAENLRTDRCIYVWRNGKKLIAICSAHVDDLKLAGEKDIVDHILSTLTQQFGKLKIVNDSFEHCGIWHEYQPSDGSYHLHQNHFTTRLKLPDMEGISRDTPTLLLTEPQIAAYLSGLGSLAWLVQTRMDVAIYIQALQRNAKKPTVSHMLRLCCVIKWCKRKPCHLRYCFLPSDYFKVLVCNDAAFRREDSSGLAMRGSIIAWAEDRGSDPSCLCNTIDFFSRKQRRICRSTFGAELNAAADGIEVGRLVAYTLAEIVIPGCTAQSLIHMDESGSLPFCLQLVTDCRSLFDSLRCEETAIPTEQSLIMLLLQLKESMKTGTIKTIVWADTRDLISDGLTKGTIARADLLAFSMTSLWKLKQTWEIFAEPVKVTIVKSRDDAVA